MTGWRSEHYVRDGNDLCSRLQAFAYGATKLLRERRSGTRCAIDADVTSKLFRGATTTELQNARGRAGAMMQWGSRLIACSFPKLLSGCATPLAQYGSDRSPGDQVVRQVELRRC